MTARSTSRSSRGRPADGAGPLVHSTATRTAAREWARHGITVNAICPGAKSAATRRVFAEHPELEVAAGAANPMGRLGDPERDIAPVAVFLAGDDSSYLTGNTLFVDAARTSTVRPGLRKCPTTPDSL